MSDIRHDAATMRLMKHYGFSRQNAATIAWAVLQEADAAIRPQVSGERAEAGFDASGRWTYTASQHGGRLLDPVGRELR